MAKLPSGTVSMLFSDVEQSTRLLMRLGRAYEQALDSCQLAQRSAWVRFSGVEMGTEGDSFFVVFSTAEDAVGAAVQAQVALGELAWRNDEQVRVRMGIHTGTPRIHGGNYVGLDVHRAARIAAAAHGGQVLVSDATAKLVAGRLPQGVSLRDLGAHRLKDLAEPEHLHQLAIPGLPVDFPPLKSLGASASLPVTTTPLLGRRTAATDLVRLLVDPQVRLVTLTGPGGSGKTRLSIAAAREVAEHFPDGVCFASLAAFTSPRRIWSSIGEVLGLPSDRRAPPGFFEAVAPLSAVFVLDNLEQMDGAAAAVDQLLHATTDIVVLATSRRALNLTSERQYPVLPLALPTEDTLASAKASAAVRLFVERARAVHPSFVLTPSNAADVSQICRHLDGLPLAIELAAARTNVLGPRALRLRLERALDLRGSVVDRPARHSSLRATIDWSYRLLTTQQRLLFRHLGVFAGGANLGALAAVHPADTGSDTQLLDLAADLVDANLVTITDDDGEPRFAMLETIRSFAIDELAQAGELADVRRRHAEHFLKVAERLDRRRVLTTPSKQAGHLFGAERNNLRAALVWASAMAGEGETEAGSRQSLGLALLSSVAWMWKHEDLAEVRQWLEAFLKNPPIEETAAVGRCLADYAETLELLGMPVDGREAARRSVEILQRLGDSELPYALAILGSLEVELGDRIAGRHDLEASVLHARESADRFNLGAMLTHLAFLDMEEENWGQALELLREAVDLSRGDGVDYWATRANNYIAIILGRTGRAAEALELMSTQLQHSLRLESTLNLAILANDYSGVLAAAGLPSWTPVLLGAADAELERRGIARNRQERADITETCAAARTAMSPTEWTDAYQRGHNMTITEALEKAIAAATSPDD
ncbi:adenylate/guanylate cyclase domain-containing protein [Kribbella sp. NPDC049584]|uniref:ATP-binding protein n=1 Tax=Kribbella sp. NPDC049584 TaxID=3154833 RepID=UPI00342323FB